MELVYAKLKTLLISFGLDKFNLSHLIFLLSVTIGVFLLEMIIVGWSESSFRSLLKFRNSTKTDLILWVIEALSLYNIMAFTATFGICYYLAGFLHSKFGLDLSANISNIYLKFAIIFYSFGL